MIDYYLLQTLIAMLTLLIVQMNKKVNYELLLNLQSLKLINLKQTSFIQFRVSIFQHSDVVSKNTFAMPIECLDSNFEELKPSKNSHDVPNIAEIDYEQNTFITKRILVRMSDDQINVASVCTFKGTFEVTRQALINPEIKVLVELLTFHQNQIDIADSWIGYTLTDVLHSAVPIFFSSYRFTMCLNASFHCIISSVSIENAVSAKEVKELSETGMTFDLFSVVEETKYEIFKQMTNIFAKTFQSLAMQLKQLLKLNPKMLQNDKKLESILSQNGFKQTYFHDKQYESISCEQIEATINKMSFQFFLQETKQCLYRLSQKVYEIWKKFQQTLIICYNSAYFQNLHAHFNKMFVQYRVRNNFEFVDENQKNIEQQKQKKSSSEKESQYQSNSLQFYPFEKHYTKLRVSENDYMRLKGSFNEKKRQVIIFVHGYQASSFDMEPIRNYIKYKCPEALLLLSSVNESRTEQPIEDSAHRLAIEIKNFINSAELKQFQISFVCHSLGGIIARASLQYLQLYKLKFNSFITVGSPHLGYLCHSSTLITTSLWILNQVKKEPSMLELTMSDHEDLTVIHLFYCFQKTYLYQLSTRNQLQFFKKVILYGSQEDEYVPFWSALLRDKDFYFETKTNRMYKELYENLCEPIKEKIYRMEFVFNDKTNDLSSFIGRTAHIKILNYVPAIDLLVFSLGNA